jgi:hypothetical protein
MVGGSSGPSGPVAVDAREVPDLVIVRNDVYARFSHVDFNKGTALAELCRQLDIKASEVFAIADAALQSASDEDLFSDAIRIRLDQLIEPRIKTWYTELLDHVEEIRQIAPDYVTSFLREASTEEVDQLMKRFGITDWDALDTELRKQIQSWINGFDNENVRKYDVLSAKDLVFTELRSWC